MVRIVYAGSPAIAVEPLRALLEAGFEVVAVISQPAKPVGRKRILTDTPVTSAAREWGIPAYTPNSSAELHQVLIDTAPDLAIAVAYGRLIDSRSLRLPVHGWWNMHFSLLPRWRGATPVQHSILHGDVESGVTIFRMDEGLDTGDIVSQVPYRPQVLDTAGIQLEKMAALGSVALVTALSNFDSIDFVPQRGEASHAPKLSRADARVDWGATADQIDRQIRAVTPEPGAHATLASSGRTIGIVKAFTMIDPPAMALGEVRLVSGKVVVGASDGAVVLDRVIPAGKSEMSASEWYRGAGSDVAFEH